MEYAYHCQRQAEEFAHSIIPVPGNFPPRDPLPKDYPVHFKQFRDLMVKIYADMSKRPAEYGLALVDINSTDRALIRKSHNLVHRLVDALCRLSMAGEMEGDTLVVKAPAFREAVKKAQGAVSNAVPRYELILSRLTDFGFKISHFFDKPFAKDVETFTVSYPGYPPMAGAMKAYCDCWQAIKNDRRSVKIWPEEFHHHLYAIDYKIAADHEKIPVLQWLADESFYYGLTKEADDFYAAFYEYSLNFKDVTFNGDYNYKNRRIGRNYIYGPRKGVLSLLLKNMDDYIGVIEAMPDSVKQPFTEDHCGHCSFQGATDLHCKFRRKWTLSGVAHEACAHYGFRFSDYSVERVPDYWKLLELEYGLKRA